MRCRTGALSVNRLIDAIAGKRLLVFDYDGTLANLDVDWDALRRDLRARSHDLGFESDFRPLWTEMTRLRDELGYESVAALFPVVAEHEDRGLAGQRVRPEIVELVRLACDVRRTPTETPVMAVYSANLHRTVDQGLKALGVRPAFKHIVGADDVRSWKPAPEGLLRLMRLEGQAAEAMLFIGDSANDAAAARRAGVTFLQV